MNEESQKLYDRLLVRCQSHAGYNTNMDDLLKLYVFNLQEAGKLAAEIEKEGSTYEHTNKSGFKNLVTNPRARMYFTFTSQALKLAKVLNLRDVPHDGTLKKKKSFDTDGKMKVA